jgi:lysozyme
MLSTAKLIEHEESFRSTVYRCSEGYPTWLIGKKVGTKGQSLDDFKLLKASRSVALVMLQDDLDIVTAMIESKFDWFKRLNQARKDIIISMCYQLGFDGFCEFKKTIKFMAEGKYKEASIEMLDSLWAKQTPARAKRHSDVFASGDYASSSLYNDID